MINQTLCNLLNRNANPVQQYGHTDAPQVNNNTHNTVFAPIEVAERHYNTCLQLISYISQHACMAFYCADACNALCHLGGLSLATRAKLPIRFEPQRNAPSVAVCVWSQTLSQCRSGLGSPTSLMLGLYKQPSV